MDIYYSLEHDADILPNLQNYSLKETTVTTTTVAPDPMEVDAPAGMKYILKQVLNLYPHKVSEIKVLLKETQPSKSKWANNTRIGQDILYPALEKVLGGLRAYTDHSFPFLRPVQKKEAPNYYDIITNPMDLGTVGKNLKNLKYNSKSEFKQDLDLIWSNCLKYNTLPESIYRKHAHMMMKKQEILMKKVPDVVIKSFDYQQEQTEMDSVHNLDTGNSFNSHQDLDMLNSNGEVVEVPESSVGIDDATVNTEQEIEDSMQIDSENSDNENDPSQFDFTQNPDPIIQQYNKNTVDKRVSRLKKMVQELNMDFGERQALDLKKGLMEQEYPELYAMSCPESYIVKNEHQTLIQEFMDSGSEIPRPPLPSLTEYDHLLRTKSKVQSKMKRNISYLEKIKKYFHKINLKQHGLEDEPDKPVVARLQPTRSANELPPFLLDYNSCFKLCVQKVAFILEHQGFDCGSINAVEVLAEIMGNSMTNSARLFKQYLDQFGHNMSMSEITLKTLEQFNTAPKALSRYCGDELDRYGRKLKTTGDRLQQAYFDYQRRLPTNIDNNEEILVDEENILDGNLMSQIGIDFYNLKEIGLDCAVPYSLWKSKSQPRVKQSFFPK